MEKVDILKPPTFEKSGKSKTIVEAWNNSDWIGTFNLWIIQRNPIPSILYQQRSPASNWAPNKLDVTAGGHYSAGEEIMDGLREVKEELGKTYDSKSLTYIGRKLHVSPDVEGRMRQNVVEIFLVEDNSPLGNYKLQEEEVYAICACPIDELIKVHTMKDYTFQTEALTHDGRKTILDINKESFPYNWDNYHFKIALIAQRYIRGEKNLLY